MTRRVLLTGRGGFIGSRIARALEAAGAEVLDARALSGGGDLLDPAVRAATVAAARADTLVHAAWVTAHGAFWSSELNRDWAAASADLFARFAAAGGRRILGIGTVAEYDWTTGADRITEATPLAPATPYGAAKARTGEALAELAAREGLSHAWARVFHLFGPGEPPARLIPAIIRAAITGEPLDCGPGETARDFTGVEALGKAVADLALSPAEGAFNVATGRATRFADLARIVGEALGAAPPIRFGARALGPGEPVCLVAATGHLRAAGIAPPGDPVPALADYARALSRDAASR